MHDGVACGSTNFFSALYNIYCWGVRPLPMPPRKLPVPRAPPHPHPSCVLCCLSQLPEGTGAKVPPKRRRSSHMRPCCYYLRFTGTWVVSVRLLTFIHVSFYFSVPACLFMEISCLCCIDHGTTDQFSSDFGLNTSLAIMGDDSDLGCLYVISVLFCFSFGRVLHIYY